MREVIVEARRALSSGVCAVQVRFPAGWEVRRIDAVPSRPPLAKGDLPGPRSLALPPGRVLFVVNDAHRPTPTPWLLGRFDVDPRDPRVGVIVATGSHAPPTPEELRGILGPLHDALAPRTRAHRATAEDLLAMGATSRGTPVDVNRSLVESESVICLGSVEPHYFAGWTGGRKSLVPGLAAMRSMRANHRLALAPGAATGALEANPLHLDLVEAVDLVRGRLSREGCADPTSLNVVLCRGEVHGWRHGPVAGAVEALAPRGREVFGRVVPEPAHLVVCLVDHPLDRDLYQSLKALEHWKGAVAPGGALVIAADCPEGIGPPTFTQFLETGLTRDAVERRAREEYRLGDHKLVSFLRYLDEGRSAILASPGLDAGRGLPLAVRGGLAEAIAEAVRTLPEGSRRALLVEDAAATFPFSPEDI